IRLIANNWTEQIIARGSPSRSVIEPADRSGGLSREILRGEGFCASARGTARVEEDRNHTRRLYCLPPGIATCYPRSVNRNIFYIIGVIVVIVIVLKLLHVF